jgi:hypothetical protein
MRRLNPTMLALIGGLVILILVIAYFATSRNPDQDRLSDDQLAQTEQRQNDPAKLCASKATYELIKSELFRRAAQLRGSDQAAFDKLSAYAVVRMENPVLENQDSATGALNCSGSLSLDLPPGVAVVGGRRTLTANLDYTLQRAADGSGEVVLLRNPEPIITPLATLARVAQAEQQAATEDGGEMTNEEMEANVAESESLTKQPGPPSAYPGRPSFDCNDAQSRGEIAVCSDSGLSALDVNMATQYRRATGAASPEQRAVLQQTRDRFLTYRDHCTSRSCIADAYVGRMREIRDIMEGRWRPKR